MVTKSLIMVLTGSTLLGIQALLPRVVALRSTPNVDEFMIEDQRTHTRQNYVVQRGLDAEMITDTGDIGPTYVTEPLQSGTSPEELPALIVDYANMIRNDIILLDNSVETRTRKRGNIKKFNQAIPDPLCSCEPAIDSIDLGQNNFPRHVEFRNCTQGSCTPPYGCKEIRYFIRVLTKKNPSEKSNEDVPLQLRNHWTSRELEVSTGCVCIRDYNE